MSFDEPLPTSPSAGEFVSENDLARGAPLRTAKTVLDYTDNAHAVRYNSARQIEENILARRSAH